MIQSYEVRARLGNISPAELALLTGISKETIEGWETLGSERRRPPAAARSLLILLHAQPEVSARELLRNLFRRTPRASADAQALSKLARKLGFTGGRAMG